MHQHARKTRTIRAKWAMDGAATLAEAAEKLQALIEELAYLDRVGWALEQPIADDYGEITLTPGPDVCVVAWDWKDQMPLDDLKDALSRGYIHLSEVDTKGDWYAIALSRETLDEETAEGAFLRWSAEGERLDDEDGER